MTVRLSIELAILFRAFALIYRIRLGVIHKMENDLFFPRLVHFFGPDGAGKSLQADILIGFLARRGFKVRKCWLRAHHTLAFILWKLFVRIGFYRVVINNFGFATKLPAVDRDKLWRSFWSSVEFISILPIVLRVHLSLSRGYRVVAERYLLDSITAIAYVINDPDFLRGRISKMLLRLIPENTVFIFLDSDYETIRRRRARKRKTAYDYSRGNYVEPRVYIEFQRTAYKILANSFHALIVDTSKTSIGETSKNILQYLGLV